jgi:hypothetical protein
MFSTLSTLSTRLLPRNTQRQPTTIFRCGTPNKRTRPPQFLLYELGFDTAGNIVIPDPHHNNRVHNINPITGGITNTPRTSNPGTSNLKPLHQT